MANVLKMMSSVDPLAELQRAFGLIKLAGKIWIVSFDEVDAIRAGKKGAEIQFTHRSEGKLLLERYLENLPVCSDPRDTILKFYRSPCTTMFHAVAFSPNKVDAETLNFWSPSPIKPQRGSWSGIGRFLFADICGGYREAFRYLVHFLAHMVQKPHEKPGVMLVMLGGAGTGKGTFFRLLEALWPHTTLQVSDVDHVIGKYNAALDLNYVVCMDEALFSGDKRSVDRLKSFVTEPRVTTEQKNQPRKSIQSYHRFFASSNRAHFAQVDADDRRFVMLAVSDAHQGEHQYWKQIHSKIADPATVAAFLDALMKIDLTGFDIRVRPSTNLLLDQKLRSLEGFDRYWFEVLQAGSFNLDGWGDLGSAWTGGRFVSTSDLLEAVANYEKGRRVHVPRQRRDLHDSLRRLCPSALSTRASDGGGQRRGFDVPSLAVARQQFETYIGGSVQWGDEG